MTHEEYLEMVRRLEEFAGREPKKYALRVGLLAALGYAYVLGVLAALVALIYLIIRLTYVDGRFNFAVVKFSWVLVALVWVVLRALWVQMPAPEGIGLTRGQAPRLFALADELAAKLGAPRVHVLQIDGEYNASLAQVPRLGPFGWQRNYLTLGLPLMQALTPEQFRAVIAHELGHLSGNHGRFGSWVYRVRQTWVQLLVRLEREERWGAFAFTKFVNWFAPYFDAYSFVLARRHEYDADKAAARVAGAREAARALAAVEVKGAYLSEKYWPEILRRADEQREPTPGAFAGMWPVLREGPAAGDARQFLRRSLQAETGYEDTHPALAQRLGALGLAKDEAESLAEEVAAACEGVETAAEHYLGGLRGELSRRLDEEWVAKAAPVWRERHERAVKSRRHLAELEEKSKTQELNEGDALALAELTAELRGVDEAAPLLRKFVERNAGKRTAAPAHSLLGQILLAKEDESGVEHMQKAAAADHEYTPVACQVLYGYLRTHGREEEAEAYRRKLIQYVDTYGPK
ncbi:MAG TPA: M48 family metalloprotease [Pyrinomonadaceae bacterium]|nr:M48 family metalloprotease [Pyrinomonadaceae bacterium]